MRSTTYVALVDDHSLLRNGLAAIINSFDGYKVVMEADHGQHFIDQLKGKQAPDILLLDITMPVMNGYETAEWTRVNLPETKILVLSMMESDTIIINMLKRGAKGYLLKDSKPDVFHKALNSVRDNGFYINEKVTGKMLHYLNDGIGSGSRSVELTDREIQFLKLCCSDLTYKSIAKEMFISPRTVDSYRDNLFEKLGVSSRTNLVIYAMRNGIIPVYEGPR
jgi:DNA-binding NarL/FixJ family response regulator